MYAVIETGGKQYRVTPGDTLEVETLAGDAGSAVEFARVLAVVDGTTVKTGKDAENATVTAEIVGHDRGDKILVFKFKRKKQYKKTIGHRQNFTRITVKDIQA